MTCCDLRVNEYTASPRLGGEGNNVAGNTTDVALRSTVTLK